MQAGDLKPILTTLVLPPAGPLLLALLGLAIAGRRRRAGLAVAASGILLTLALACTGVASGLARTILPQVPVASLQQLQRVQAIVVLGGGVEASVPEYGSAQLTPWAFDRLRYGAYLARHSGKPLAYAGGQGWGARSDQPAEAEVAAAVLQQDYGLRLRWLEQRSRDTRENADNLARLLAPEGIQQLALVTDAWHMPRALHHFRAAGFEVLPAPINFLQPRGTLDDWLPTADGLRQSRQVLREWLALRVSRIP